MSHWGSLVILVQHSTAAAFGFLEGGVVALVVVVAVPVKAQSTPAAAACGGGVLGGFTPPPCSVLQPQVLGFTRNDPET